MRNILRRLSRNRFPYEPLITVEISKANILHNLNEFRQMTPSKVIAPVLKSNAYGHGLFEVADILKHHKEVPFFSVDSYYEAVALRAHGFRNPLLILGFTRGEAIRQSALSKTSFTIISLDGLKELQGLEHSINIHLKIDTGMHRQGILLREIPEAIAIIKGNKYIKLEGMLTHFSEADNSDETFTRKQILDWNKAVEDFTMEFKNIKYVHAAATDGTRFADDIKCNVIRLGIGLYGLSENEKLITRLNPLPALAMKTIITGVKKIYAGETVGYGNTFTATRDMTIATIPVGYFEGLDRRMSNNGVIQVGENVTPCPIVGRVSMNITTIDISGASHVKVGTPVVVMSKNIADENSVHSNAKRCGTTTYEMVVKIPAHLKRVVVD